MRLAPSCRCSTPSTAATPDPKLLAYQYLQMLPQIAQGDANKVWIVPSELHQGTSARYRGRPTDPEPAGT